MIIKSSEIRSASSENIHRLEDYLLRGSDGRADPLTRRVYSFTGNCAAEDPELAATEMELTASANTRIKNGKFLHFIVSLREGEHLDSDAWQSLSLSLLGKLGLEDHQFTGTVHGDTDHEHLHLVIGKVNPLTLKSGNLSFLHRRLQSAASELEELYGLRTDRHQTVLTAGEREARQIESVTGQESFFSYLLPLKEQLLSAVSWQEIHSLLAASGVRIRKRGHGITFTAVFEDREFAVKASSLDRELSLSALEKRIGPYEPAKASTEKIPQERAFTQQPVNFHTPDSGRELYKRYLEERRTGSELAKFARANSFRQKRQALAELREIRKRFNRALRQSSLPSTDAQKSRSEFENAYAERERQISEKNARELREISRLYPRLSYLDWLKREKGGDEKEKKARELLLSRYRLLLNDDSNQIGYTSVTVSVTVQMRFFSLYKRTANGQEIYTSPYSPDQIRDDGARLVLGRDPSMLTVTEALLMARERYGDSPPLIIRGELSFQKQCAAAAAQSGISIFCASGEAQRYFTELMENENERRKSAGNYQSAAENYGENGNIFAAGHLADTGIAGEQDYAERNQESGAGQTDASLHGEEVRRGSGTSHAAGSMHLQDLPAGSLAAVERPDSVLLHGPAQTELGQPALKGDGNGVRRKVPADTEESALTLWLRERNRRHAEIASVPEHRLLVSETGTFEFTGLRHIGNEDYALLNRDGITYVRRLSRYAQRRLSQLKRQSPVNIRSDGVLEAVARTAAAPETESMQSRKKSGRKR